MEPLHSGHCWEMVFWLLYGCGCCRGVPLYFNTPDQGCWPLYRRWLLLRGDRYEGFHCIHHHAGSLCETLNIIIAIKHAQLSSKKIYIQCIIFSLVMCMYIHVFGFELLGQLRATVCPCFARPTAGR